MININKYKNLADDRVQKDIRTYTNAIHSILVGRIEQIMTCLIGENGTNYDLFGGENGTNYDLFGGEKGTNYDLFGGGE